MAKKLDTLGYETNKPSHYMENYRRYLQPYQDKAMKLLELGVHKGGSLLMWRDFLEKAIVVGLDADPPDMDDHTGRIHLYKGLQQDTKLLDLIGRETAPEGFDVIIDDASHIGELTRLSFLHLFENHLKPGGLYVIEDWGTGYWDSWSDGAHYTPRHRNRLEILACSLLRRTDVSPLTQKVRFYLAQGLLSLLIAGNILAPHDSSHRSGMVGFVKELVDECAMSDVTYAGLGISPPRPSRFKKMEISLGQVMVVKAE